MYRVRNHCGLGRPRNFHGRRILLGCDGWRGARVIGERKAFQAKMKIENNGRNAKKHTIVQKNTKKCSQSLVSSWLCGRFPG